MSNSQQDSIAAVQAENARLIALLEAHGIEWRLPPELPKPLPEIPAVSLSPTEKVGLFRSLFQGRNDIYPVRWESKNTGKAGYSPACANEWRVGVCQKPRVKCAECTHRLLEPVTDSVIYDHLAGEHTVGVYPLLPDDTCYFLAIGFDKQEWQEATERRMKEAGAAMRQHAHKGRCRGASAFFFIAHNCPEHSNTSLRSRSHCAVPSSNPTESFVRTRW